HTIRELRALGARLAGRRIKMINSTAVGGGVAEILSRLVPMMKELGVDAHWEVIEGAETFFQVTKQFHYALQGDGFEHIGPDQLAAWLETNRSNAAKLHRDASRFDQRGAACTGAAGTLGRHGAPRPCRGELSLRSDRRRQVAFCQPHVTGE